MQLHVQVVDLEVAADHRGSILGDHPTRLQPPQKMFESKLLHQMRNFSVHRPVFIESESSLVGRRQVPNAMWKVRVQHLLPVPERDAQCSCLSTLLWCQAWKVIHTVMMLRSSGSCLNTAMLLTQRY